MSKNIDQVYSSNPITTIPDNALVYFGLSPYETGNDAAMIGSVFKSLFAKVGSSLINEIAVFGASSLLNGNSNFTYDSTNDVFINGGTSSFSGGAQFTQSTILGNNNYGLSEGTGQSNNIFIEGNENGIDVSAGSNPFMSNIFISGCSNYFTSDATSGNDFIYQYGFSNSIGGSGINTLSYLINVGLENSISCPNTENSGNYGQNNEILSTGSNGVTDSYNFGYGNTITANNGNIANSINYGYSNNITKSGSFTLGQYCNVNANNALALGYYSTVVNNGSVVISDASTTTPNSDSDQNQFVANFSGGLIFNGNVYTSGGYVDRSYTTVNPTNGQTINIQFVNRRTIIIPATPLTTLTIVLPGAPVPGQVQKITVTQPITNFIVNGAGRNTLGAPTTISGPTAFAMIWDNPASTWVLTS